MNIFLKILVGLIITCSNLLESFTIINLSIKKIKLDLYESSTIKIGNHDFNRNKSHTISMGSNTLTYVPLHPSSNYLSFTFRADESGFNISGSFFSKSSINNYAGLLIEDDSEETSEYIITSITHEDIKKIEKYRTLKFNLKSNL